MRRNFFNILLVVFVSGCAASVPASDVPSFPPRSDQAVQKEGETLQSVEELPADSEALEEVPITGLVFGKTEFEGAVKTSYVKFFIIDQNEESRSFELIIGDKARQQSYPWKVQTVKPGYFFIELPPSRYKINALSIPVGTTTATESMDIEFDVMSEEYNYLGTLRVNGTKEKIKLGGVPVIKPGFEYRAQVIDEREEAFEEFRQRYPDREENIRSDLMQINLQSNVNLKEESS